MKNIMVSGYGQIVENSLHIINGSAKFTIQNGKDRFFVTVSGYEQCHVITTAATDGPPVFVVGKLFSFVHNGCKQHHVGIDADFVLAVNGDTAIDAAMFTIITRQLVSKQMRNGNGNGKTTILA